MATEEGGNRGEAFGEDVHHGREEEGAGTETGYDDSGSQSPLIRKPVNQDLDGRSVGTAVANADQDWKDEDRFEDTRNPGSLVLIHKDMNTEVGLQSREGA